MTFKLLALLCAAAAFCQTPQPAPPPVEAGAFPQTWITGGPNCLTVQDWQIHEYNSNLYILRESGCTNYEKPFLYLFFGRDKALLIDTGAGVSDAAAVTQRLIARWLKRNKRDVIALVVAHTHAHGDHTAGDKGFEGLPNTTLIPATAEAAQKAFGIDKWPEQAGTIDLGGRVIDVIAIPGHQPAHVAYYDRQTAILHTGDHLYPGRLYVTDFAAYEASTRRLVEFTATRPVSHVVGCHIEQSVTPFVDYPVGTTYQPHEHVLELGRAHLLELLAGLEAMHGKPERVFFRDFTIWPANQDANPDRPKTTACGVPPPHSHAANSRNRSILSSLAIGQQSAFELGQEAVQMRTKLNILAVALIAGGTMFAQPRVSVGIGVGGYGPGYYPPPAYSEYMPPSPGSDYAWTNGYWVPQGGRNVWINGFWRRPYVSGYRVAPRYVAPRYDNAYRGNSRDRGYNNRYQSRGRAYSNGFRR